MKDKLAWCAGIKNGIILIDPNDNLASAYQRKAEEAMEAMHSVSSFDWKISTGYYSLYFSLYSVLMKIGIKSENHSCTIEIMQHLLTEYFTPEDCDLVETARRARVETQYYVTNTVSREFSGTLSKRVPRFFVTCKSVVDGLDEKQVHELRKNLMNLIDES
ncbi:HEPN domain-containing protein [Methanogenium organophilum]|uniref:HEPN domain-containing protein n=1 Tax=Methanogenium organophilum TaxID=2199 RepID=A0A9X9T7W7_METOG|nr:HEPN domain-containing protein [Methanogenium organophilum]WAI01823.1 HEPN domain-containing protein [Methanogenium organophilum]